MEKKGRRLEFMFTFSKNFKNRYFGYLRVGFFLQENRSANDLQLIVNLYYRKVLIQKTFSNIRFELIVRQLRFMGG